MKTHLNHTLEKEAIQAAQQLCHKPGRASLVIAIQTTEVDGGISVDYTLHSTMDDATPRYVANAVQALSVVSSECLRKTFPKNRKS